MKGYMRGNHMLEFFGKSNKNNSTETELVIIDDIEGEKLKSNKIEIDISKIHTKIKELDESLITIKNQIEAKQQELAQKATQITGLEVDKRRLLKEINTGLNDSHVQSLLKFTGKGQGLDTIENEKFVVNQSINDIDTTVKELDKQREELERGIARLSVDRMEKSKQKNDLAQRLTLRTKEREEILECIQRQDDYQRDYPLHIAAYDGNFAEVQNLLRQETNTCNQPDIYSRKPLFYACMKGHDRIFRLLYEATSIDAKEEQEIKMLVEQNKMIFEENNKAHIDGKQNPHETMLQIIANCNIEAYDKLWKVGDISVHLTKRIMNIFEDYYAPLILSGINIPKIQRILTLHWNRNHLQLAEDLKKIFEGKSRCKINQRYALKLIKDQIEQQEIKVYIHNNGSFARRLRYIDQRLSGDLYEEDSLENIINMNNLLSTSEKPSGNSYNNSELGGIQLNAACRQQRF
jgi:ankyrin repeat protein